MNKMVIIAGEIATGPGLGSSSVIINKIRRPRRAVAASAKPASASAPAPQSRAKRRSCPCKSVYYY